MSSSPPAQPEPKVPICSASKCIQELVQDMVRTMRQELDENSEHDAVVHLTLRQILDDFHDLLQGPVEGLEERKTILHRINVALRTLLALSQGAVATLPFHRVDARTLALYTDASLLLSSLELVHKAGKDADEAEKGDPRAVWRESVRRLDMAIIVAGAVGPRRTEWAHALIAGVQRKGIPLRESAVAMVAESLTRPPSASPEHSSPPRKRQRTKGATVSPPDCLQYAPSAIPSTFTYPASHTHAAHESHTPLILRSYLAADSAPAWPALERWKNAAHLLEAAGEGRVVPVEVGRAYDEEKWGQRIVLWEDFLRRAGWDVPPPDHIDAPSAGAATEEDTPLYLAQHSVFNQFPSLERDIALPDYVWTEPPAPPGVPYTPPADVPLINVWVGPGGADVVSPAHTDPYYNAYAQVVGSKRVWLAPPDAAADMYAYGDGAPQPSAGEEGSSLAEEYMTNTSRVPILRPLPPGRSFTDLVDKYPRFFEHVYPRSLEAVLRPGDVMLMPPGWWHAMRGEGDGPCWSVSFWY